MAKTRRRKKKSPLKQSDLQKMAKDQLAEARQDLKAKRSRRIVLDEGVVEVIEEFDPSWAELLLANLDPNQRKVRPVHLARIERALRENKFEWTGAPYIIDEDLNLIDGQHRCTAVVNTGKTIRNAILITVKNKEVMTVIDTTSAPRSLGDIFKVHGNKAVKNTVSAAIIYEQSGFQKRSARELSKPEKYDLLRNYDLLEEANDLYNAGQRGMRITSGPLAGALACVRKNHDLAMKFFSAAFANEHFLEMPDKDNPQTTVKLPCPPSRLARQLAHSRTRTAEAGNRTYQW